MMALVRTLSASHEELLRRYQELQLSLAIARALGAGGPSSGLPRERLEKELPPLSYASVLRGSRGYDGGLPGDGECAVCQTDLEPTDRVRLFPCRHAFHVECIDPWLQRSTCCPTCRASVCPESPTSADK